MVYEEDLCVNTADECMTIFVPFKKKSYKCLAKYSCARKREV